MAGTERNKTIAVWVISGLLGALFMFAGVPKVMGAAEAVEGFAKMGYPSWFLTFIGLAEIAGGVGLLIPGLAHYAAVGLMLIMFGAIYTILSAGMPGVAIPIVCLLLLGVIAYLRRPA